MSQLDIVWRDGGTRASAVDRANQYNVSHIAQVVPRNDRTEAWWGAVAIHDDEKERLLDDEGRSVHIREGAEYTEDVYLLAERGVSVAEDIERIRETIIPVRLTRRYHGDE